MQSKTNPTVFLIDDDESVRKALSRLLCAHSYAVETFPSAQQYLLRAPYRGIGCIVLDVCMPGLSGMDLQQNLISHGSRLPIIFLTAHADVHTGVNAMKRGAADFLTKPIDKTLLIDAIESAIKTHGKANSEKETIESIRERVELLTEREREVMQYVISGALNKQIAARLDISEKTVKTHRGRAMEKMCVDSVAELVRDCAMVNLVPLHV